MGSQEALAAAVRRLRRQRALSQEELANAVNDLGGEMTQNVVTRIERGTRKPTLDEWLLLARALNTAPLALLLPASAEDSVTVGDTDLDPASFLDWFVGQAPFGETPVSEADVERLDLAAAQRHHDYAASLPFFLRPLTDAAWRRGVAVRLRAVRQEAHPAYQRPSPATSPYVPKAEVTPTPRKRAAKTPKSVKAAKSRG